MAVQLRFIWLSALFLAAPFLANSVRADEPSPFAKWEKAIQAFEKQDLESPPEPGGTLFIGSSSIRLWDLERDFPGKEYVNRGFGGSEVADSVHFFDRIVMPHRPSKIVMYAGDNDVGHGKSPETVFRDFKAFVDLVRKNLPETEVIYIAIKPSGRRWSLAETMQKANGLIAEFAAEQTDVTFVDIWTPMLGPDGMPRPELFVSDQLHMTEAGYAIWKGQVAEALAE